MPELGAAERARIAGVLADAERAESFFGFSLRRRLFYEGRLLTMVGDYAVADAAHRQTRQLYPPQVVGDPAIMSLDRATALVDMNEAEAGAKQSCWMRCRMSSSKGAGIARRCRSPDCITHLWVADLR